MHELLSHHLSCPDFDVKYFSFLHNYFLPAFNNFAILENYMRKLQNWTDLNASVDVQQNCYAASKTQINYRVNFDSCTERILKP